MPVCRFPFLIEKYVRKDIGGVGAFPNPGVKPESGYNVELGFKQGYNGEICKDLLILPDFIQNTRICFICGRNRTIQNI